MTPMRILMLLLIMIVPLSAAADDKGKPAWYHRYKAGGVMLVKGLLKPSEKRSVQKLTISADEKVERTSELRPYSLHVGKSKVPANVNMGWLFGDILNSQKEDEIECWVEVTVSEGFQMTTVAADEGGEAWYLVESLTIAWKRFAMVRYSIPPEEVPLIEELDKSVTEK